MKIRFIGDTHGDYNTYIRLVGEVRGEMPTIHLGDIADLKDPMGGYGNLPSFLQEKKDFCLKGNHEIFPETKKYPYFLPDYGFFELDGITFFYLAGGLSLTKGRKMTEGIYYPEEELDFSGLYNAYCLYREVKPDVLFSHEGAMQGVRELKLKGLATPFEFKLHSTTSQTLEYMVDYHRPKVSIFAHWHLMRSKLVQGTDFICVGKNTAYDLNLEKLK